MMRDPVQTIGNLIDKQKTAYLGSVDAEGFPNVKAMLQPNEREGIHCLYFSTNTSSMRVSQYQENDKACVYFCDKRFFRGVMLRGRIEVLTDAETKRRLWREGDERYYPGGGFSCSIKDACCTEGFLFGCMHRLYIVSQTNPRTVLVCGFFL